MRIRNVTLLVSDIEKSREFYKKLGFKVSDISENRAEIATDSTDQNIVIFQSSNYRDEPGKQIFSLYKENAAGFFQKCKIVGVPFEKDLQDTEEGKSFAFRDPDGNKIEVLENKDLPLRKEKPEEKEISNEQEEIKVTEEKNIPVADKPVEKFSQF